ncbi:MAG TPA: aminoglycoside phosphotransferase, partial [Actinomycetota bacterium]|nr:aminoglycoside phosphotransferase [Actinomycetota bacterium]
MDPSLPAAILPPELAAALGGDGAALKARELTHNAGNQATGGIWRVEGPSGRAVVKLATAAGGGDHAWATSDHGHHWNAWRREVLAYQTGFAQRVYADAGLGAPRLLAAVEPRPGTVALWLEDVAGLPGARWPVPRLADFAERLGRAQAGWAGRELPHPWLSRRWLRQYVASKPIAEPVPWDHAQVSALWPAQLRAG